MVDQIMPPTQASLAASTATVQCDRRWHGRTNALVEPSELPADVPSVAWSVRSNSGRRPSDYESKSLRPACTAQTHTGCSRQRGRPLSAFLTCRVMAGGMTVRLPGGSVMIRTAIGGGGRDPWND